MRQIVLLISLCGAHLLELRIRPVGTFLNQMGMMRKVLEFLFFACPHRSSLILCYAIFDFHSINGPGLLQISVAEFSSM